jgi:hypothetical protein
MSILKVDTISTIDMRSNFDPATAAIVAIGGVVCREKI